MIEYQCPHCNRTLKVPEKFVGFEGACSFCGARITIPADVVASEPDDSSAAAVANAALFETPESARQARLSIERLAKELEAERIARLEAEAAREVAEERVRTLEKKVVGAIAEKSENTFAHADIERMEAQLAQGRREVERLAKELEAERALRAPAVAERGALEGSADSTRGQAVIGETPLATRPWTLPVYPASRGRRFLSILVTVFVVVLLLAVSLWRPSTESIHKIATQTFEKVSGRLPGPSNREAAPGAPQPDKLPTGQLEIDVSYDVARIQGANKDVPASGVPVVVVRQRLNRGVLDALLQEAEVPQETWDAFAEWYYLEEPDRPDVKRFHVTDLPAEAAYAEVRAALAALAERLGREVFESRLEEALSFDPPSDWVEYTASAEGKIAISDLEPGRYFVRRSPETPREKWTALDAAAANSQDIVTVRPGQAIQCSLHVEDTASLIHGEVVDADTAKRLAKVALTLTGDAAHGKKMKLITGNDGTFRIGSSGIGYGEFNLACEKLPKGYVSAVDYTGIREIGVSLSPIVIQLSKKPLAKSAKKATVAGRILNPDGSPAPGFGVWMVAKEGSAKSVARAGSDGTYTFEHAGGPLKLYASGPGSARTETVTLDLQPTQSVTRDFVLPQTARLVLTIRKPDGNPPEAFQECSLVTANRVTSDPAMMRSEGDRFVIPYLVPGVYDLSFKVKGFKPVSLTKIEIGKEAADREISVTLERAS